MNTNKKEILDINDLKNLYPALSIWTINKAIREYNMPVIRIGRKRYFSKESIDLWLNNLERKEEKENE